MPGQRSWSPLLPTGKSHTIASRCDNWGVTAGAEATVQQTLFMGHRERVVNAKPAVDCHQAVVYAHLQDSKNRALQKESHHREVHLANLTLLRRMEAARERSAKMVDNKPPPPPVGLEGMRMRRKSRKKRLQKENEVYRSMIQAAKPTYDHRDLEEGEANWGALRGRIGKAPSGSSRLRSASGASTASGAPSPTRSSIRSSSPGMYAAACERGTAHHTPLSMRSESPMYTASDHDTDTPKGFDSSCCPFPLPLAEPVRSKAPGGSRVRSATPKSSNVRLPPTERPQSTGPTGGGRKRISSIDLLDRFLAPVDHTKVAAEMEALQKEQEDRERDQEGEGGGHGGGGADGDPSSIAQMGEYLGGGDGYGDFASGLGAPTGDQKDVVIWVPSP